MRNRALVIALAVASPGFGQSAVRVQFDTTASGRQCAGDATLIVQGLGSAIEQRITVSSTQTDALVQLRGERATVWLAAPGCWGERMSAVAGAKPVVLRLVRAALIGGRSRRITVARRASLLPGRIALGTLA